MNIRLPKDISVAKGVAKVNNYLVDLQIESVSDPLLSQPRAAPSGR